MTIKLVSIEDFDRDNKVIVITQHYNILFFNKPPITRTFIGSCTVWHELVKGCDCMPRASTFMESDLCDIWTKDKLGLI